MLYPSFLMKTGQNYAAKKTTKTPKLNSEYAKSIFNIYHCHKSTKVGHLFLRSDSGGIQHRHLVIITTSLSLCGERKRSQEHNSHKFSAFVVQVSSDNRDIHVY